MARLDSFYLAPEAWGVNARLEGDEAHHLAKVLRLAPGAVVRCFDGQGRQGLFTVAAVKGGVGLVMDSEVDSPPRRVETWLALGWNKSARRGWLLEKSVELDCAGLLFWESARSQGAMPAEAKDNWRAQLIAGAKQCGNPWLPELGMATGGLDGLIERTKNFDRRWLLWESPEVGRGLTVADLTAGSGSPDDGRSVQCASVKGAVAADGTIDAQSPMDKAAGNEPPGIRHIFVLGPEGGLTDDEAARLQAAGFTAVTLGPRPLRWETAALLCLGLAWWAGQGQQNGADASAHQAAHTVQAAMPEQAPQAVSPETDTP